MERFRNQETKYIVVLLAFPGHTDVKDALILKFIDMDLENQLCSLSLTSQNWFQNSSVHLVMKAQNVNTSVQIQRKVAKKNSLHAQKAHEKSCIYQEVPCPSLDCKEIMTFKGVDDHMKQCHKMLEVNKEWNFEGTEKDLNETICCLSSYDQKFFPQVFVKDKNLYFKVIILNHEVNTISFDVTMTFFLENGKNISMKDSVFPVTQNDKEQDFSIVSLKKVTEYFDTNSMERKCQPKIEFCLEIVNEKLDEIEKDKKANVESGKKLINMVINKQFTN